MGYVVYRSSRYSLQVAERKRTPLGRFAAWCVDNAADTVLHKPVAFLMGRSIIGRLTGAITANIVIGVLIELAFRFVPSPHSFAVCAAIGAVVGLAAQGAGGAIVGALWGWLVGTIADAVVSDLTYEPTARIAGSVAAWCIAAVLGWLAGRVAARCFDKLAAQHRRVHRILARVTITIALASVAVFLYRLGVWVSAHYSAIWSTVLQLAPTVGRWALIVVVWGIAVALPAYWFLEWLGVWDLPSYDPYNPTRFDWPLSKTWQPFWYFVIERYGLKLIVPWLLWVGLAIFVTRELV
jgi:uncharacterized protein (DUF697 family)